MKKCLKLAMGVGLLAFGVLVIGYVLVEPYLVNPDVDIWLETFLGVLISGPFILLGTYFINETLFYPRKWAIKVNIGICIIFGLVGCLWLVALVDASITMLTSMATVSTIVVVGSHLLINIIWLKASFDTVGKLMEKLKIMKEEKKEEGKESKTWNIAKSKN